MNGVFIYLFTIPPYFHVVVACSINNFMNTTKLTHPIIQFLHLSNSDLPGIPKIQVQGKRNEKTGSTIMLMLRLINIWQRQSVKCEALRERSRMPTATNTLHLYTVNFSCKVTYFFVVILHLMQQVNTFIHETLE